MQEPVRLDLEREAAPALAPDGGVDGTPVIVVVRRRAPDGERAERVVADEDLSAPVEVLSH